MKVLFLEDRPDRQKLFLPNKEKDVIELSQISEINLPKENVCKEILEQINVGRFVPDEKLKLIIVHRSALKSSGISYLNGIGKNTKIKLIYFSGGISQTTYFNDSFEQININSSDFYSDLLIPFLKRFIEDENTNLLEVYNKNWKLSYLLLYRQIKSNLEIETDDVGANSPKRIFERRIKNLEKILGNELTNQIDLNIDNLILNS